MRKWAIVVLIALGVGFPRCRAYGAGNPARLGIRGVVRNTLGRAVSNSSVSLIEAGGKIIARSVSDAKGRFSFSDIPPGVYAVRAEKKGFEPATAIVTLTTKSAGNVTLSMASRQMLSVPVVASRLAPAPNTLSPSAGGSEYRFNEKKIDALPQGANTPFNQVLLQAPGVVQNSHGQVHIRGQHANFQYRINGVQLPEGTGGFGQILSPRFASSVSLLTGTLPAQYSYRTAGIVDVRSKTGCADPGGSVEMFGGQRATLQPGFELGGCKGKLSYYLTGFYLQNDLGLDSATPGVVAIHDHTIQGQGFGYLSYLLTPETSISLISGLADANYEIPAYLGVAPAYTLAGVDPATYASTEIAESQFQQTYFNVLALKGVAGPNLSYRVAAFSRYSQLNFHPDPVGDLVYDGVASKVFHSDIVNGLQGDFAYRRWANHTIGLGFYGSGERFELDNHAQVFPANSTGQQTSDIPISVVDNNSGTAWLFGLYLQDQWHPMEKLTLNYGLRWDLMDAFTTSYLFGPRISAVYQLTPDAVLHAGYARYFSPPPFENVSPVSIQKFRNTTNAVAVQGNTSILPETDDYFDAGVTHRLTRAANLGVDSYFILAHNLLDEGHFGQALIYAPFNYRNGRIYGVEATGSYNAANLSAYANFTFSVAQGTQVATGQYNFTPAALAYINDHYVYLDHDQRFTGSAGASYRIIGFRFSVDAIYENGLRRGFANTGEMPPHLQVDAGITRSVNIPRVGEVDTRLSVVNLFDHVYQIRNGTGIGVFAPQYGPRRAVYLGVRAPLAMPAFMSNAAQP